MARRNMRKDDAADIDDDEFDEEDLKELQGWSFRRKFFVVILVIIVIIAAFAATVLLDTDVQQVLVLPPVELEDDTGIRVEIQALLQGSGSANGEGELVISHNGVETYSSPVKITSDTGILEIKYNEFVTELGEYEIIASFKGKSSEPPMVFDLVEDLNFGIAEYLEVSMLLPVDNNELINDPTLRDETIIIQVTASVKELGTGGNLINPSAPPKDATLELTITHEDGYNRAYVRDLKSNVTMVTINEFVYYSSGTGPGPGNYTVSAKITNNMVKPSSPKYMITLDDLYTDYLNILPVADAGNDISESPPRGTDTIDIEFDASDSWNDGEIISYIWDFDLEADPDTNIYIFEKDMETTSPKITHTFSRSSSTTTIDTYVVALVIIGDAYDPLLMENEVSVYDDLQVTIVWPLFPS